MEVVVKKNYEEMSRYAAEIIAECVKSKPDCVLGLASGSTPRGTYKELMKMHKQGLDFSRVKTFNLDEYLGLGIDLSRPYAQDQSYARFMHEEFFKHVNLKKENIRIPEGRTKDLDKHCRWYEEEIRKAGGIDLQLLGIGRNGHIAFNEPGSSLESRTRVGLLTKETLDDNYESFFRKSGVRRAEMPRFGLTMGIGTILESRHVLMLASGKNKAEVVARALEGPVTSRIPASAIQLHSGRVTVVLDKDAASKLKNRISCESV